MFLFVPEEGFFDGKVDEISAKFGFIESIRDTVNVFVNYFENVEYNEALVVTLNLSSAKSSYDYGQKAVAISMEWYKPYKATGDAIISAIIWLVFLWSGFTGLPSLISGMRAVADILTTERNYIISTEEETEKVRSMIQNALTTKKGS